MANTMPALLKTHFADVDHYDPDADMAGKLRLTGILVAVLLVGFVGAGALIPIGGAVIGSGQIGSEARIKRISHAAGGTVAAILVQNGQHVHKGQILVRLDDKVSGADAMLTAMTVDQMLATKARLEAERLGVGDISFPEALARRTDASAVRAMADERRMFAIRRSEQAGMAAQLTARLGEYEQQIAGYRAQISALQQQKALIAPELKGVQTLYEKRLVTLTRLNQLERTAVDLSGSVGALNAQIAQARARIAEGREQRLQLGETRRSEAGEQLAQINSQLNQQQLRSVTAADAQDRTTIRAPYDGIVEKLALTTIGGVVRPADVIMEIVPDDGQRLVEGSISPSDVDQVHVGQSARIRLSGLNSTATPEIPGRIVYVAAERVTDPDGQRSYFPVRVALDAKTLAAEKDVVLKMGMPAEIFVETTHRSMLSYITKPLRDQFARAFRDN
ncbi:MAG TPA: HlyD family type I secretion periplasmic adaptor subunit [Sphingobium sp.]